MERTNVITQLAQQVVIIPDPSPLFQVSLATLFTSPVVRRCQSVFLYSPLNDGFYNDNTLPILVGGPEVSATCGQPLLPGEFIYLDIDSLEKVFVFEPTNSGTQILVVTVSG